MSFKNHIKPSSTETVTSPQRISTIFSVAGKTMTRKRIAPESKPKHEIGNLTTKTIGIGL
jgi:hypothetical protein